MGGRVETTQEASVTLRNATSLSFERVSAVVTADLANTVKIEHYQGQQFAGSTLRDDDLQKRTRCLAHRPPSRRQDHDGATG
jgi:hypothetical protein